MKFPLCALWNPQAQYADFQVNDPFAKVGLFKGNKHAVVFSKMPGEMIAIEVVGFLVIVFSVFFVSDDWKIVEDECILASDELV